MYQRDGLGMGLLRSQAQMGTVGACRNDFPIHITCESEGEVLEEDGIVEIPAVGNGVDDRLGHGVSLAKALATIDAHGFGRGIRWQPDPPGARGDADAFDIGEFEDAVVGVVIVGESDAVAKEGIGICRAVGHVLGGDIGGDEADLADAPVGFGDLVAVVGVVEGFADDEAAGGVGEEVEIDSAAFFHQGGEGGDAVIHELQGHAAGVAAVFEIVRGIAFGRPVEADEFPLVASFGEAAADAAVALDEVGLGNIVAVHEDDEVLTLLRLWRSHDFRNECGAVDFVGGVWILLIRNFEKTCRPWLAGKRAAFDGAGADNVVRHVSGEEIDGRHSATIR
jgi:hypothetical protein